MLRSAYGTATLASVLPETVNGRFLRKVLNAGSSAYATTFKVGGYTAGGVNVGGSTMGLAAGASAWFVSADNITFYQLGATLTSWGANGIKQNGTNNVGLRVGCDFASGKQRGQYSSGWQHLLRHRD